MYEQNNEVIHNKLEFILDEDNVIIKVKNIDDYSKPYRYHFKLKVTSYNIHNWDYHNQALFYILDVVEPDPKYVPNFAPLFIHNPEDIVIDINNSSSIQ